MTKHKITGMASRFTLASTDLVHRTIACVTGEVGSGKTHFTLTAPEPILIQNIDKGTEGVIEQFRKQGKEIYEEKYDWRIGDIKEDDLQSAAIEIRDKWEADYRYAIDNGVRSVSWDTESRIWQVCRYAEFGSPNADSPRDYDVLNQRYESLINDAKERNINLFLIRSMKDKWGMVANAKTGKKSFTKVGAREEWGYEHLPGLVFTELGFFYDEADKDYKIRIGKCRHNSALQFSDVPRCSFAELGTLMIEDSTEEEWG